LRKCDVCLGLGLNELIGKVQSFLPINASINMMTPAHCDKSPLKEITLRTRKSNCFKEEGAPIGINTIACLECSCHIWVPQLTYFDKIHHAQATKNVFLLFRFSHFSQCDSFHGVGSHICAVKMVANTEAVSAERPAGFCLTFCRIIIIP
jgi:hypothetical protein